MFDTLYVVETEDDIFIGALEFIAGGIIIRNGFQGHPKTVMAEDITQLVPAHMHASAEAYDYVDYIQAV